MGEGIQENRTHSNYVSLLHGFYLGVPPKPYALIGGLLGGGWNVGVTLSPLMSL